MLCFLRNSVSGFDLGELSGNHISVHVGALGCRYVLEGETFCSLSEWLGSQRCQGPEGGSLASDPEMVVGDTLAQHHADHMGGRRTPAVVIFSPDILTDAGKRVPGNGRSLSC